MTGLVAILVVLLLTGVLAVPTGIALCVGAVLYCLSLQLPLEAVGQMMIAGVNMYTLAAIPLFLITGNLMRAGNIPARIFKASREMAGWLPGGLAQAGVLSGMVYGGLCDPVAPDAGKLGAATSEEMAAGGYDPDFSNAATAVSSVIGNIFMPGVLIIVYCATAGLSIVRQFTASILPGLLVGLALMLTIALFAAKREYGREPFSLHGLLCVLPVIVIPLYILYRTLGGVYTPTEVSSLVAIYALLAAAAYRALDWPTLKKCLIDTAVSSVNILFLISVSSLISRILSYTDAANQTTCFLLVNSGGLSMALLVICVILIALSAVMDPCVVLVLGVPVLLPALHGLGVDPLYFGVLAILSLAIGQVLPPFGARLRAANSGRLYFNKTAVIFVVPMMAALLLFIFVPSIVMWLPRHF